MDYMKHLQAARSELVLLLDDQKGKPRKRGNLAYLLAYTIRAIDDVMKFYARYGDERKEEDDEPDTEVL